MKDFIIKKTLDTVADFINEFHWSGACFATSAINYILLKEQGVSCKAKLGVVVIEDSVFDHAWIEIDDLVYDVAIIKPLENNFSHIIGIDGLRGEIESGEYYECGDSTFIYGFEREVDQENLKALDTIGFFMSNNAPYFNESIDYWTLVVDLGEKLDLSLCKEKLIEEYSEHKWIVAQ